jgi:integrase
VSILHDILKVAVREEVIGANPAAGAERPRVRQKRWRILKPAEVALVARSFGDEQARVVFLTLVICGLRRHELQALRWRDVDLVENVLRVADSKTEDGVRSIAIPASLAEALWQHRRQSSYQGEDELVFHHPDRGTVYRAEVFAEQFVAALKAAGVTDHMRPFHDLRHTSITNDAASGSSPIAVMTKAGHSDMRTTKRYLHLAGVVFRDEADRLEQRYGLGLSTEPSTEPTADSRLSVSATVT